MDGSVAFVLLHQGRGDASNSCSLPIMESAHTASHLSVVVQLVLKLIKYSLNNPTFCLQTQTHMRGDVQEKKGRPVCFLSRVCETDDSQKQVLIVNAFAVLVNTNFDP